jgi:hypothetical protein
MPKRMTVHLVSKAALRRWLADVGIGQSRKLPRGFWPALERCVQHEARRRAAEWKQAELPI